MPIPLDLKARLELVARRERRFRLWSRLALCWGIAAAVCVLLISLQRRTGWGSSLALPAVALAAVAVAGLVIVRRRAAETNWRAIAQQIEARHPELDGRLLTAAQQHPRDGARLSYLQQRVVDEALGHGKAHDWAGVIPQSHLRLAQAGHWLALLLFLAALMGLHTKGSHSLLSRGFATGITVTPGDATIERGSTLVVLARFTGPLPSTVDLVVRAAGPESVSARRLPLVKSLADPMFGGSVPEVASNFVYHIEYGGQRTRDFNVSVFDYPRLERADADLAFPQYTRLPPQHVENTRRLSAVEGSRLDLALRLNKAVATARLVPKHKDQKAIALIIETNRPAAALKQFAFETSNSYDLQLVDGEGRTNKVQSQFVFDVLTNRTPELHLASPRGDLRPSSLEEISFEGSVWDDFGVEAYGLGYALVGQKTTFIELGRGVPAREKRLFQYLLRLEELGVQPDDLISWFIWADDVGPNGQVRRTTGDLFFAEVRPFEEVFREAQGADDQAQSGDQSGQQGGEPAHLADLQKQIISATWKLLRDHQPAAERKSPALPSPQSRRAPRAVLEEQMSIAQPSKAKPSPVSAFGFRSSVFAQPAPSQSQSPAPDAPSRPAGKASAPSRNNPPRYEDDAVVVRDSQAQALEQAESSQERQQDPRASTLWTAAIKDMEKALAQLNTATNSPAKLPEALAAEQAAYQALLRLQQHEYQVSRARNRNQRGSGRNQQMQRQLEQMDLAQSDDRYETQRQAQAPQPPQRREQLQVMSRLQELSRRQQDLNDRLKELQTALQEARTEQERAEIQRRLKRLQEEEQQMLADVDELRQRMDQPDNQSRMNDERRQLDETRDDVQRAADAAAQGAPSQALAAGTRAQRQFQQLHDQMRKENSSQFSNDLREMRNLARELARQQEEISRQIDTEAGAEHKSLSGAPGREALRDQLGQQKLRLTNLVDRATDVSQQAENAEPLLSRQLYDAVRKFTQDSARTVKDTQDELLNRGLMTRRLYDQLKESSDPDGAKMLDLTSALLEMDAMPQAKEAGQSVRAGIDNLKRGVERAAENLLGDDTEALRLAQQELDQLTDQLRQEIARSGTNAQPAAGSITNQNYLASGVSRDRQVARSGVSTNRLQASSATTERQAGQTEAGSENTPGSNPDVSQPRDEQADSPSSAGGDRAGANRPSGQSAGSGNRGQQAGDGSQQGASLSSLRSPGSRSSLQPGAQTAAGGGAAGANWGGYAGGDWERDWNGPAGQWVWPLTGEDFLPWSDRLRDVEEMIEQPDLRNAVAVARERARVIRQEYRHDHKKPDWAVVQLQVMKPLVEVRDHIAEELARRNSREALVPLDRDPVPDRYADLVRKYYEDLGKGKP
jgi:hypothetical protein